MCSEMCIRDSCDTLCLFNENDIDDVTLSRNEVNNFDTWCKGHEMTINSNKCKALNVDFSCHLVAIIPCFENTRPLFNEKLSWADQFKESFTVLVWRGHKAYQSGYVIEFVFFPHF